MLAVASDTLKLARKPESAGFPAQQAQDASAALAESITEWHAVGNLATREDVQAAKDDLRKEIQVAKDDLRKEIQMVKLDVQKLDAKISETKAEILKWMFGAFAGQTFVLLGALTFWAP